jgi:hypothetical protein
LVHLQEIRFQTSVGRGVFSAIFNPPKLNVSELFLPRRTAFVYELEDGEDMSDIPTTLRRSKLDCPPVSVPVFALMRKILAGCVLPASSLSASVWLCHLSMGWQLAWGRL